MRFSTQHGHDLFRGHSFFHHGLFWHDEPYDERGLHRGWFAALGIFFILAGVLGLLTVSLMTIASVIFFGILAIAGGIVQITLSFSSQGRRNVFAGALLGVLYLIAGIVIVSNPLASSLMLTLFLAGALIALGIVRIGFWSQHRTHKYWIWSIVSGILSIALGVLIFAQWPATGLWVIGLFVSLEMIMHGAAAVSLATESKRLT